LTIISDLIDLNYSSVEGGDFMKKALAIIVSLVFVLSIAGLSFAKEKRHATKAMHANSELSCFCY